VTSTVKSRLRPTVTPKTQSRLDDEMRASNTTMTIARATTTTVDADGATTATTTVSAAGHQASEVRGPLAGASVTRSSPRASRLRPTYLDTMGTPTPVYGSRTIGSHATSGERLTTSSSSRIYRSTSVTPHAHGSSNCRATRSTTGPTASSHRRQLPGHIHAPWQAMRAAQLQATTGGESPRVHTTLL
jgi:hypothetical protein